MPWIEAFLHKKRQQQLLKRKKKHCQQNVRNLLKNKDSEIIYWKILNISKFRISKKKIYQVKALWISPEFFEKINPI